MNIKYFLRDNKENISKAVAYQILKYPYVTEKTTNIAQMKYMTFIVDKNCNKCDIKKACKLVFEYDVEKVNIINQKQRMRAFKGKKYQKSTFKKAMVLFKNASAVEQIMGGSK